MLPRVLEPEVMDTEAEARDYDAMDHAEVNRVFVADLIAALGPAASQPLRILDVGTGTALIPIALCGRSDSVHVTGIDLAAHMLALGRRNVIKAGLSERIVLERVDAKATPYPEGTFDAVVSNSIVHHIPEPHDVLVEMVRVVRRGGRLFVRDLLRPPDDPTVNHLVRSHAGDANGHQRAMFEASLRAALTITEIRDVVRSLGFRPETAAQTTDRHWTWSARRPS